MPELLRCSLLKAVLLSAPCACSGGAPLERGRPAGRAGEPLRLLEGLNPAIINTLWIMSLPFYV